MTQAKNTLTVRNEAQRILVEEELKGQLSDGMWENTTPHDHWKPWCDAQVIVNGNVGRNFHARKDNYNLVSSDLLDVIGERMIKYVQDGTGRTDYDMKALKADLRDLKVIFKTYRAATQDELSAGEAERVAAERRAKAATIRREKVAERATELIGYVSPYGQYGKLCLSVDQLEKLLDMATTSAHVVMAVPGAHVVCANFIDFTETI